MTTAAWLGAYGLGLTGVFIGALALGATAGPVGFGGGSHPAHPEEPAGEHGSVAAEPGGLAVSRNGYTLVAEQALLRAGERADFRFTITGPDGAPVTDYSTEHERDLHLIVVRRDLSGFQHLHPTISTDGVWSVPLTLPSAGAYRVFADFVPASGTGEAQTLGVDVHVPGRYRPQPPPAPAQSADVDGYTVRLTGGLRPDSSSRLAFSVSKADQPVADLQPYLGAYGHLVVLRSGDLGYLHVHPTGDPVGGDIPAGPDVSFATEVPSPGTYRLYLDFKHRGVVRTAEFTATAAPPAPSPPSSTSDGSDRHRH